MTVPIVPGVTAGLLLCFALYRYILQPTFFSRLSNIPAAHWSARYLPFWIWYHRYHARNNATTLAAHEAYGSIVLLGPNELSINCVDNGIRTIYGGGFEKHDWYPRLFPSYGVINMFSMVGHGEHSARKRLLSNVYSKSYLQNSPQVAANSKALLTQRFLPLIQKLAESGESVDVHAMNNAWTMDFMSAYQFGLSNSTNLTQDVATRKKTLHEYHCRKEFEFYHQEVPWLRDFSKWLGRPLVPKYCDVANDYFEAWNIGMCDGADKILDKVQSPGDDPVVYRQFKTGLANQQSKVDNPSRQDLETQRLEVASEMLDHLGAGHETSAIALTYIYYELSLRPDLQDQLRKEVLTLDPPIIWPPPSQTSQPTPPLSSSSFSLPSPKTIDTLPLLHAIIMETLRLHTPIPGIEPRITPSNPLCTLAGHANIPSGVRVSAMPYTLHRNGAVFPEPRAWKPERWLLPPDSAEMKEMLRWFWAFGSGGRMCIGSNLAM
jgi:cytochrome P450